MYFFFQGCCLYSCLNENCSSKCKFSSNCVCSIDLKLQTTINIELHIKNIFYFLHRWTPVLRCVSQLERLRLSENVDRDLFRRPFPREAQHVANDSVEQDKHVGVDANDNERSNVSFQFNISRVIYNFNCCFLARISTDASKSSSNASRASLSPTATRRAAATVPLVAPAPVKFHFHSFILFFQSVSKHYFLLFQDSNTADIH